MLQRFVVSPQIAAIAIEQAGYIDAKTKSEWMYCSAPQLATRFGRTDQYRGLAARVESPPSPATTAPVPFGATVTGSGSWGHVEGVVSGRTITTSRGITLADASGTPASIPKLHRRVAECDDLNAANVDFLALDDADDPSAPHRDRERMIQSRSSMPSFLSINKDRLIIGVLGKLQAPAAVESEVLRKASQDARLRPAATVWKKLTPTWIEVLPDELRNNLRLSA